MVNFLKRGTKRQGEQEKEEIKVRIIALARKFLWKKASAKEKERKKKSYHH